jgi:hypothetical protein
MLQVPDQYAGQQMRCPLCNNIFTVPGLPEGSAAPAPVSAPVPPPAHEPYKLQDAPVSPPPPAPSYGAPSFTPPPPPAPREPEPPVIERDYMRMKTFWISKRSIPWIAPIAMGVLFLLTFFPWLSGGDGFNVWSLGYGKIGAERTPVGGVLFIFYTLLVIFGLLASVGSFLITLGVIPRIPPLDTFRPVIVGGFVWLAFLLLFLSCLINLFRLGAVWLNIWGHLGWWAHFTAAFALLIETWLAFRGREAPSPRVDIHL